MYKLKMPSIVISALLNTLFMTCGYLYHTVYNKYHILATLIFAFVKNMLLFKALDYFSKKQIHISPIRYKPVLRDYFNIFMTACIEIFSIMICHTYKLDNLKTNILTFIPMSFYFEIVFDFFHYWTHRLCHTKYFYRFHKTHHHHTTNISAISTYNHDLFDLLITNVIPIFLTSWIVPLSQMQYFMWLLCKTYTEIGGHISTIISTHCFCQCVWLPKIFNIESRATDHYLHHAKFNCNFSKRFTLWDKLFGTYVIDPDIAKRENEVFKKSDYKQNNFSIIISFLLFLHYLFFVFQYYYTLPV